MVNKNEIVNILLWIFLWNLFDYISRYFKITEKNGILITTILIIFLIYFN